MVCARRAAIAVTLYCCLLVGFGQGRVGFCQEASLGNKAGLVDQGDGPSEPVPGSEAEDGLGVHGYAKSGSVRIHYVTRGEGPLLIMIHGFPDYWYTWREQIPELAKSFRVVAIDQRGYNYSDKPDGVASYGIDYLVSDIAAVIQHFDASKAVVVGHDWGGMVAWSFALKHPEMTDRLIILNLPHPNGLRRELATNPDQQKNSAYARFFQSENASQLVKKETLVGWVKDPKAKARYLEAMERSSLEGMLNYYKANYPREPYTEAGAVEAKVQCSVLMFHGLKDKALLASGLNGTWDWLEKDLTLITIPDADHFVQQDASGVVTKSIVHWLVR
ncbi:MAG: alpha/beta hydrolase [Planctomycetes bacterium]|nr:alpha/beta hydrolase [Planctomycetota bacterium]